MTRFYSYCLGLLATGLVLAFLGMPLPATAQSALTGAFDTDQPIEILADVLEVQQTDQSATFAGNVQVLQGDIRLKADRLTVFYMNKSDSKQAAGNDGPANIRSIEAEGNVFMSSPRETAEGERGIYDVINKRIDLLGNVVLTQGQNVLKGQKVSLDLVSGKSRIEGTGTGNSSGRVRGIFVPGNKAE
ncbi:lipopolysaccharide transport periplasmic protein LptA [Sneathiella chinensis]|uniref:Organic solvent tolerance protein OstA n=1 Tax=Sneathiella chinensis TaxID=349750 RepID=A0ABQ5U0X4_9PROT|nr:lipopolysaccharide transport periplasmic protein LptA [Sneathiella chinensis]GLQ04992.1 organic solvent tolerance protein OstA [Sneathiella chinensis]